MNVIISDTSKLLNRNKPKPAVEDDETPLDSQYKFDEQINKKKFPVYFEAMSKIRDEIVEAYPTLILCNLHGKKRTLELSGLLKKSKVSNKQGRILMEKLKTIDNHTKEGIVEELKKMNTRDYNYLHKVLNEWQVDLDEYGDAGKFHGLGFSIKDLRGDVERWLNDLNDIKAVRKELVQNNMPLVVSVANRPQYTNLPLLVHEDIINHGVKGLTYAVDNFSPKKGAAFSTYAVGPIASYIKEEIRPSIWKTEIGKLAEIYLKEQKKFRLQNDRLANEKEMLDIFEKGYNEEADEKKKVDAQKIVEIRLFLGYYNKLGYYLDDEIGDGKETFKDFVTSGVSAERLASVNLSKKLFWKLTEEILGKDSRELLLIKERFIKETRQEDLITAMTPSKNTKPVSRTTVGNMEKRAIDKLKKGLKRRGYEFSDFQF